MQGDRVERVIDSVWKVFGRVDNIRWSEGLMEKLSNEKSLEHV